MCSRYRLVKEKIVVTIRGREVEITLRSRYNIGPQQDLPVLIPDVAAGARAVVMKWGWRPAWSKQLLINAQGETVREKAAFEKILRQRCLIPADGFYEWLPDKTPMMFTKPDGSAFCFAGLWMDAAETPGAGPEPRFVVLTTSPNASVASVHNRMPLIVPPEQYGLWFEEEGFGAVLERPDRGELASRAVRRDLNNVKNGGPRLIEPGLVQGGLF